MNKFLSLVLAILAIAQASAFMSYTPVLKAPSMDVSHRNGASSMEMRARVCDLLGKRPNRQARVVTFSHRRIKKVQHVNLQTKKFFSDALGRNVKLRVSTKAIKTINKIGSVDAAAKKFGVELKNF